MKKLIYSIITVFLSIYIISCSDMNDMHDPYMKNGEITYIGRVDSMQAFSGRERVLIHYWLTDPRVKTLHILWNQGKDSLVVTIPEHDPLDVLSVMIGEGETKIKEGDYTFFFYSHDDRGHRSVKFETLINVYGDRYQATLNNRSVKKVTKDESKHKLTLEWGGSSSVNETGVEILYTDMSGMGKKSFIDVGKLSEPAVIEEVDFSKTIQYQTWYKPSFLAIDQFNAPLVVIQ